MRGESRRAVRMRQSQHPACAAQGEQCEEAASLRGRLPEHVSEVGKGFQASSEVAPPGNAYLAPPAPESEGSYFSLAQNRFEQLSKFFK